jgi:acetoacetyl-CoA synthetase
VGHPPTPATIDVLTPIWQRVLRRADVGPEDNFFDLGGDPSSAAELFGEIAKVSGRELSPLRIYQAPTLAALAALLEQPATPRFPAVVPIRVGGQEPAIFVTHGLGGCVTEVFHLARNIHTQRPIYGLQSKGYVGNEEPLARVEDMAEVYLEAMKALQPHGPYILIGYSFGGLVMLEIAQRLLGSGQKVALLAMLETYPHRSRLLLMQRLSLYASLAKRHAAIAGKLPIRKKLAYLTRRSERRSFDGGAGSQEPGSRLSFPPGPERVRDADAQAWARYQPRFYRGKVNFVKAAVDISLFPRDPEAVWANLVEEFVIDSVPGNHFGIVSTFYRDLAAVLSRQLAAAFSGD